MQPQYYHDDSPSLPALSLADRVREQVAHLLPWAVQGLSVTEDPKDTGVLILQGQSRSFYYKQQAQEAAKRIPGVRRICNQIDVVYIAAAPLATPSDRRVE